MNDLRHDTGNPYHQPNGHINRPVDTVDAVVNKLFDTGISEGLNIRSVYTALFVTNADTANAGLIALSRVGHPVNWTIT